MTSRAAGGVSVIVPTLREVGNLLELTKRLDSMRRAAGFDLELLLMDDDSRDGTAEWVRDHAPEWVRLVVRTENPGLAPAVVEGIALARHPRLVVMDCDLSHAPESIPDLLAPLADGAELVIGSRHVAGASTDEAWHWLRAINSRLATLLARPLTRVSDPMAGFLAFPRELVARGGPIDPIGFKIGLELIVKCQVTKVVEVPIHFALRHAGTSKLSLREQWRYLVHLTRLYRYRLFARR